MKYVTTINEKTFEIEFKPDGSMLVNGEPRSYDFLSLGEHLYSVIMDNQSHEAVVEHQDGHHFDVMIGGKLYDARVMDERSQLMANRHGSDFVDSGEISIAAPMPGLVADILVHAGQDVAKGDTLVILESMKMQNEIKAPRDGTVQRISVEVGDSVEQKRLMVTLT